MCDYRRAADIHHVRRPSFRSGANHSFGFDYLAKSTNTAATASKFRPHRRKIKFCQRRIRHAAGKKQCQTWLARLRIINRSSRQRSSVLKCVANHTMSKGLQVMTTNSINMPRATYVNTPIGASWRFQRPSAMRDQDCGLAAMPCVFSNVRRDHIGIFLRGDHTQGHYFDFTDEEVIGQKVSKHCH